ncbi:MAG: hypothetical protein PHE94_04510 [Eubacteriales bacterium]|nr:hypothetical protein [Eubacteriales bacterium]
MTNTMKLLTRILIILVLMAAGAWLNEMATDSYYRANGSIPGLFYIIPVYAVYLLIGIALGSVVNPRFTKKKWIYLIPILIFAVIGSLLFLYPVLHVGTWPFGIGNALLEFSNLSWTIAGFFLNLILR